VLEFDHHLVTLVVLAAMLADIEAWWPGGISRARRHRRPA